VSHGSDGSAGAPAPEASVATAAALLALCERVPMLVVILDREGRVDWQNERFARAFGSARGAHFDAVLAQPSPGLSRFVARLLSKGAEFRIEDLLVRTPHQGELRADAHGFALPESERAAVCLLDQTERVTAATSRAQRERFESISRFAGGLSHDLTNMLSAVVTTAQAALQDVADGAGDASRDFRAIVDSAQRGAALARSLRAIAFDETGSWRPVDLAEEIRAVAAVIGRGSASVPILLDLEPELPEVVGDRARLHQLVLNLMINARDATRDRKGSIEVQLARASHGGLVFSVADSGPGVPVELRDQVFQPYFTTKREAGQDWGTGLGLAIVDAVARSTGARVRIETSRAGGALFIVEWPAGAVVQADHPSVRAPTPILEATTVLLVDREPALLDAVGRQLRRAGHVVIGALTAFEGRERVAELGTKLGAAVIEISLSDADGRLLAAALRNERPELAIVLTSAGGNRTHTPGSGAFEILPKPYDVRELVGALERAVRSASRFGASAHGTR
jgi:signal transduction histidine kinase/ActR/RegA family two-component response regulator